MLDLVPYAFLRKYFTGSSNVFEGLIEVNIPAGYTFEEYLDNDSNRDDTYGGAYPGSNPTDTRKVTVKVKELENAPATPMNFTIPGHAQAAGITKIDIHVYDTTPNLPTAKDKRKGKVVVHYSNADDRQAN